MLSLTILNSNFRLIWKAIGIGGIYAISVSGVCLGLTIPISEDSSSSTVRTIAKIAGRSSSIPVSPTRNGLIRFDVSHSGGIKSAENIKHARLTLYCCNVATAGTVTINRITQDWSELFAMGKEAIPRFARNPIASIDLDSRSYKQFIVVDITEIVKDWYANSSSDYGVALVSGTGAPRATFGAKEGPGVGYPASLEIEIEEIRAGSVNSPQLSPNLILEGTTMGNFEGRLLGNATSASTVGGIDAESIALGLSTLNSASSLNISNTIVLRDDLGSFQAGTITGAFRGDGSGLTNVVARNGIFATSLINANTAFMEFVRIANPGNSNDTVDGDAVTPGTQRLGAVMQSFLIGKYEVTNYQYTAFLNSVASLDGNDLYNERTASDARGGITRQGAQGSYTYSTKVNMADKPVIWVSYYDALRFCNWIHNGKPIGTQDKSTTEDGAYLLIEETYPTVVINRKLGARAFIPTENEWYKAAYYDPIKGGAGGYFLYPTRSDTPPALGSVNAVGFITNTTSNISNYGFGALWNDQIGNVSTVGSGGPGAESAYGAADMGGNVFEWTESIRDGNARILRGGAWGSWSSSQNDLQSSGRYAGEASVEQDNIGFRIALP